LYLNIGGRGAADDQPLARLVMFAYKT
jgi:hypothetical protein